MKTEITTRHFELSDDLKERTEARLNKLHRFFDRIMDARVVVSLERNRYNAEATLTANGTPLSSHAESESEKAALEQVLDKLEVQIRRHKDRRTRRKRPSGTGEAMAAVADTEVIPIPKDLESSFDLGFEESDMDGLISEDAGEFEVVMSVAEAAAELKVSRREAIGFTNSITNRKTLVFKRRDGNVGVVDIYGT